MAKIQNAKILIVYEDDYIHWRPKNFNLKREAFDLLCKSDIAYRFDPSTNKLICIKNRWVDIHEGKWTLKLFLKKIFRKILK